MGQKLFFLPISHVQVDIKLYCTAPGFVCNTFLVFFSVKKLIVRNWRIA